MLSNLSSLSTAASVSVFDESVHSIWHIPNSSTWTCKGITLKGSLNIAECNCWSRLRPPAFMNRRESAICLLGDLVERKALLNMSSCIASISVRSDVWSSVEMGKRRSWGSIDSMKVSVFCK